MVFEFHRAAHEAGATTAIVNIGTTRADDFVSLKLNARLGEVLSLEFKFCLVMCIDLVYVVWHVYILALFLPLHAMQLVQILPRVLNTGSLSIPALQ